MRPFILFFLLFFFPFIVISEQDEYSFDLESIKKKSFSFGGYLEFRPVLSLFDTDSGSYKLRFYNRNEGNSISEYNFNALLDLSYEKNIFKAAVRSNTLISRSFDKWEQNTSLYEAYLSIKPSNSASLEIGKKRLKWGKGYAWNPVAFIDRRKNPNDPELALEGFTIATINYIKSFSGKLKTVSFSAVLLPVSDSFNADFGINGNINFGGKVYFLFNDTDIDIMFLSGKSMPDRYGIDFSRNLGSNLEVHGELAYIPDFKKTNAFSYLLGIRFLTKTDITFFLEYYKNGQGILHGEMEDHYLKIDEEYQSFLHTGDDTGLENITSGSDPAYSSFAPMRDYLYFRMSWKEPWGILYFIPSFTTIFNIVDSSFSIAPEILYTPVTNFELRTKISFFVGGKGSDFGEKLNNFRFEFRGRYYF
ncbi:MAG: hypothetical protein ABFR75_07615 [Acidobacteriota bacterium]